MRVIQVEQRGGPEVLSLAERARAGYRLTEHKGHLGHKVVEMSYPLKMSAGSIYRIDMESPQFDTYLRLEDGQHSIVARNDDISDTNRNSRIVFVAQGSGAYRIVATSFEQAGAGAYTISVREFTAKKK